MHRLALLFPLLVLLALPACPEPDCDAMILQRLFQLDDRHHHAHQRVAEQQLAPGQRLEQDQAEGEQVGARVHRLAPRLLGGHVGRRAARHPRGREPVDPGGCPSEAEVEHLGHAAGRHHDVPGLQVAVHQLHRRAVHLEAVGADQRLPHLDGQVQGRRGGQRPVGQQGRQRLAGDQLHRQPRVAAGDAEVVDIDDVRVLEQAGVAGLAGELGELLVGFTGRPRDHLQRQLLAEALRPPELGPIDPPHAPDAEHTDQRVAAEVDREVRLGEGVGRLQLAQSTRSARAGG